jgi:tocopherol O-methyltransferase
VPDSREIPGVRRYYSHKTESILRKYGPGPRVHFCLGLFDGMEEPTGDEESVRRCLVAAQDRMMDRVACIWEADRWTGRELLDCGCGLGGGALYWAEKSLARVTAVTIVQEHLPLVAEFARQARVADRVSLRLCDACEIEGEAQYDVAVAMEAACYFDRQRWFEGLARVLKPQSIVCVEDVFVADPIWKAPFDAYWRTDIGTLREYGEAALAAGFRLDVCADLTGRSAEFWRHSRAWTAATLRADGLTPEQRARAEQSLAWHEQLGQAWTSRGIQNWALRFVR